MSVGVRGCFFRTSSRLNLIWLLFIHYSGRAGKKGVAVSFFVAEKNGRMAREIIEILNRTSQNVPQELVNASMTSFRGGKGGGRGRGGGRRF